MATHSSILAWNIPWTEETGELSPWCHKESDTTELLSTRINSSLGHWLSRGREGCHEFTARWGWEFRVPAQSPLTPCEERILITVMQGWGGRFPSRRLLTSPQLGRVRVPGCNSDTGWGWPHYLWMVKSWFSIRPTQNQLHWREGAHYHQVRVEVSRDTTVRAGHSGAPLGLKSQLLSWHHNLGSNWAPCYSLPRW